MRRVYWTVGMGAAGLLLGAKGYGTPSDLWPTALIVIWAASIGFGFGSIFDQKRPTKRVVIYWAATLALVGAFFGVLIGAGFQLYASAAGVVLLGAIGALADALFGLFFGKVQLGRMRRGS
jgi:hypothetical protein